MIGIAMKECAIRSVDYVNNIYGTETMEIGAHVESRVDYNDNESECKCIFSLIVNNTGEKELIKIVITMEAIYSFSGTNKKEIHTKINEELFAQARGTVCALCGMVGLPTMVIPPINFAESEPVEINSNANANE